MTHRKFIAGLLLGLQSVAGDSRIQSHGAWKGQQRIQVNSLYGGQG